MKERSIWNRSNESNSKGREVQEKYSDGPLLNFVRRAQRRPFEQQIGHDHCRQQVERLHPLDTKEVLREKCQPLEWQNENEQEKKKSFALRD
jgi:hypothetical protein